MELAKFYRCNACGNLIVKLQAGGCTPSCCGKEMVELKANSTDAAQEKHVPDVVIEGNKVSVVVGSTLHPATDEHYIGFIYLQTEKGLQVRELAHTEAPKAEFLVAEGDKPVAVFAWCNLHGLWVKEV